MSEWRVDEAFGLVPLWLLNASVSDRAVRLYGLLSALRDYGTDMTTVGRSFLARKLDCSTDSLDRARAELEKAHAITVERKHVEGAISRNTYTIHRTAPGSRTGADLPAPGSRTGADLPPSIDERSSSSGHEQIAPGVPEVIDGHVVRVKAKSAEGWYTVDVEARDGRGSCTCKGFLTRKSCRHIDEARAVLGLPEARGRQPGSVAGKRVSPKEHDRCDAILAIFNEVTGKRFAGAQWRRAIIGRIREHPDLGVEAHRKLIEEQIANPWWKGDPTPAVIYSERVFDRALNGVAGVRRGGNNADDGLDYLNT